MGSEGTPGTRGTHRTPAVALSHPLQQRNHLGIVDLGEMPVKLANCLEKRGGFKTHHFVRQLAHLGQSIGR